MTVLYVVMIVAGVAAIGWGLVASHRLPGIKGGLAALLVLAGVIVTLLGALLFIVPGFFQG
ncbi:MAG: hypothetical protein WA140_07630 [Geobacteraceae bacterium]